MTRGPLVALLAAVLLLTGCSEQEAQDAVDRAKGEVTRTLEDADLPEVDWQRHRADLQDRLDTLAEEADCGRLQDRLAEAEGNDTELTRYIKALIRKVDC